MVTLPSSLVGRERERERLAAALAEAGQAGAGLAVVTGPPGIGKTALVRDLADRSGRRSLWARCVPWEANLPFGVVGQLLQPADLPSDPAGDPLSDPLAVAAFLAEWIGTSPTLITVDAAEHADRPSLRALSSLVRQHRCVPVFIAVTATFSPGPPELAGLGHEIELSGLDATAIGELARMHGRIPHPAVVERLRRHTAGNPRDLLGLLDELPDARWAAVNQALPAPRHVMAQTRENLAGCGAGGRALVEAFAILESAADGIGETGLAEAIALAGIADPFAAQDEATGSGLLTSRIAGEPHLVNPMIRAAVLESLGAVRRAELHDKASRVVSDPARRLRHRVATTDLPDAALAGELDTVATECSARGEWGAAAKLLWEASQLTTESLPRDDRLVRSFDAMVADGDILAATSLVPALESLRETPRRDAALGYLAVIRGRAAEADARLRRAWDIVNTDRDPQVAAQIAQRCTLHMLSRCRGAELVRWADTAVRLVGPDSPAGLEAAAIRGLGLAADGRSDEAERAYLALAARVPHGAQAQRIAMGHGWLQLGEDDLDAARSSLESAVSTAFL
ncbi:MAG TPA: ATP-binding protein, partial [Pseudonocardiaceae bacterium]